MAYNGGIITKPVSIRDVQLALGTTENDLGRLCVHSNINKWARFKPIKITRPDESVGFLGVLTEELRQANYYGLHFRENTVAEDLLKGKITVNETNFDAAAASGYEWSYIPPIGGKNSPYRLTDFVSDDGVKGYKHSTKPPFEIIGNWNIDLPTLDKVANTYSAVPDGTNDWTLKIYPDYNNVSAQEMYNGWPFLGYKMKYDGEMPQYDINMPDPDAIPMTLLFGASENGAPDVDVSAWRIGLIVYVPAFSLGTINFSARVGLFVCKKSIKNSHSAVNGDNVRDLSVDMCTNQELALAMYRYMSGKTAYTFRALPVLVKDMFISRSPKTSQEDIARTYLNIDSNYGTKIFPLPTGSVEIGITVMASQSGGEDKDNSTVNGFTLGTKYLQTSDYEPINILVITTENAITKEYTAELNFEYTDIEGTYTYSNSSYSIPAGSYFRLPDGTRYEGVLLSAYPASGKRLKITKVNKFTIS